jgi:hypothetical protein
MGRWIIYMIKSRNSEKVYIGSVTDSLEKGLRYHINRAERYKRLRCCYMCSYEVLKCGGISIEEIEEFVGKKKDLLDRELEYIMDNLDISVNIFSPVDNSIICKNIIKAEKDIIRRKKDLDDFIGANVKEKMKEGYSLEASRLLAHKEDIKVMNEIDNSIGNIYERWMES